MGKNHIHFSIIFSTNSSLRKTGHYYSKKNIFITFILLETWFNCIGETQKKLILNKKNQQHCFISLHIKEDWYDKHDFWRGWHSFFQTIHIITTLASLQCEMKQLPAKCLKKVVLDSFHYFLAFPQVRKKHSHRENTTKTNFIGKFNSINRILSWIREEKL